MPTVKRFDRCRIEMYFGDHPPPHFHVITRNDERISVVIDVAKHKMGAPAGKHGYNFARPNVAAMEHLIHLHAFEHADSASGKWNVTMGITDHTE